MVEHALEGKGDELKEYVLGLYFFDRGEVSIRKSSRWFPARRTSGATSSRRPDPATYVFVKTEVRRSLFRVPLH
jgi:hypothetical protein